MLITHRQSCNLTDWDVAKAAVNTLPGWGHFNLKLREAGWLDEEHASTFQFRIDYEVAEGFLVWVADGEVSPTDTG